MCKAQVNTWTGDRWEEMILQPWHLELRTCSTCGNIHTAGFLATNLRPLFHPPFCTELRRSLLNSSVDLLWNKNFTSKKCVQHIQLWVVEDTNCRKSTPSSSLEDNSKQQYCVRDGELAWRRYARGDNPRPIVCVLKSNSFSFCHLPRRLLSLTSKP